MKVGDKIRNYCSLCYKATNHTVICCKEVPLYDDYEQETTYYTIVECAGCNNVSYRTDNIDYMHFEENEFGEKVPSSSTFIFPKVLIRHRKTIKWHHLPKKISIVYEEAIKAFAADCYLLTGVAFRAVIEAICLDKNILGKDLYAKINNLVKSKLITEKEADRLHAIRFIGNDSVHEMTVPEKDALDIVLNTIEHLLNNLYIIDAQIRHRLETIIDNYDDFIKLLDSRINSFQKGDVLTLYKLLGKSFRRISHKVLDFEVELNRRIDNGDYKNLSKGLAVTNPDSKRTTQNYIILQIIDDELQEPVF